MAELRTIGGTQRVLPPELVEALSARFGDRFHVGEAMRLEHGKSETHFAPMPPDAVVFAESTDDVVALVKACADSNVPIIAFGAGTSVEGNTLAVQGGVAINLSRMTRIIAVNTEDFDCVVEAGVRRE